MGDCIGKDSEDLVARMGFAITNATNKIITMEKANRATIADAYLAMRRVIYHMRAQMKEVAPSPEAFDSVMKAADASDKRHDDGEFTSEGPEETPEVFDA